MATDNAIFCLNVVFCPTATATPTTTNAGSRGFRSAECHGRQDLPARLAPSAAIAAHNAIAMSRGLSSMIKPALVGRRHDDASPHPQESVLHINVGEGARFREGHREAMVATGIGRVERARVQEARAVIACRVPTWSTEEPIGDQRKDLPGEKRHAMDLVDRVVGPEHRVSNPHVDVLREIAHDCRVVEDHIAACR